jgi:hypothetical protein
MKNLALATIFVTNALLAGTCFAGETPLLAKEIPTEEKAFVGVINKFDKAKIMAQFGEPAKAEDVKVKDSGKIVASIWHYHNINTAADGSYYPTTELDFIDDKVVQVVFLNHDGSEANDGKAYEVPDAEPDQLEPNL